MAVLGFFLARSVVVLAAAFVGWMVGALVYFALLYATGNPPQSGDIHVGIIPLGLGGGIIAVASARSWIRRSSRLLPSSRRSAALALGSSDKASRWGRSARVVAIDSDRAVTESVVVPRRLLRPGGPVRLGVVLAVVIAIVALAAALRPDRSQGSSAPAVEPTIPLAAPDFHVTGTYDAAGPSGCFSVVDTTGSALWANECVDLRQDLMVPSPGAQVIDGDYVQVLWLHPSFQFVVIDVDARIQRDSSGWALIQGSPQMPLRFSIASDEGEVHECELVVDLDCHRR